MKTCGIIAEYNPFHNGHKYQIEEARKQSKADVIIAVMSGNFVQRGEPAIIDKWQRAEAAIKNGADVVIELPYIYATQSANNFAYGGIEALKLANVDYISFGSECGNLENLMDIAETPINPDNLHEALDNGMSYPKAYSLLTSKMLPNDILAVSYLKHLKETNIKPIIIERTNSYNDTDINRNASALAIREALNHHEDLQGSTPMEETLLNSELVRIDDYYPYLRLFLLTANKEYLANIFLVNEGIENHFIKNALECNTFEEFLNKTTNYRYTKARIKRTCLQILNQISKEEIKKLTPYNHLRVLAFNDNGKQWLHDQRKREDVHIASKFSEVPLLWRQMEYKSTLLYTANLSKEKRKELLDLEIRGAHYIK